MLKMIIVNTDTIATIGIKTPIIGIRTPALFSISSSLLGRFPMRLVGQPGRESGCIILETGDFERKCNLGRIELVLPDAEA
jgi:hypothetical protein